MVSVARAAFVRRASCSQRAKPVNTPVGWRMTEQVVVSEPRGPEFGHGRAPR